MITISWAQLENNATSKELSFESFCFQIAYKKFHEYGVFDSFYNTAGSEFYLILSKDCAELKLKAGDVVGWQAKFWRNKKDEDNSPLDSNHRKELVKGLTKSVADKPKLKHWIICTPGKFANNKPTYPWTTLKQDLVKVSKAVTIGHWHRDTFEAIFHNNPPAYNSIFNHYFNTKFVGIDFINEITQHHLKLLERKFDTDLHIRDENEFPILNRILLDRSKLEISKIIKVLGDTADKIKNGYFSRVDTNSFKNLSKDLIGLNQKFLNHYLSEIAIIETILQSTAGVLELAKAIYSEISDFFTKIEKDRVAINSLLQELHIEDDNSNHQWNTIDYHEENWLRTTIKTVNEIKELLIKNENSLYKKCQRLLSNDTHVFGAAGYGKTNFACSIATHLLKDGYPVLLLLGSSFKNRLAPKKRILELVNLDGNFEFRDFLGAMNNLGFLKKIKVPIIIDGLNESSPTADVWKDDIKAIIREINQFPNLQLITTCREKNEYIEQIFGYPNYSEVPNHLYLKGFTDRNINKAIRKYFHKKNIKPKSNHFDRNLFKDPLRLKIFSEVNEDEQDIEINIRSIIHSIGNYIELLARNVSKGNRRKLYKVKTGLKKLGILLWEHNTRDVLFFEDFYPIFDKEDIDCIDWEQTTTFQLIDEGLCFQRDLKADDELVQFTYDLVGGYQIAQAVFFSESDKNKVIAKLNCDETKQKLFGFQNADRHPLQEDILKAICFLLPQKIGFQIFEIFKEHFIILENLVNLNLLAFDETEKNKFKNFIKQQSLPLDIKTKVVQQLYSDAFQKQAFFVFDIIEVIVGSFSSYEIDVYWSELIRKDAYKLQKLLKRLVERCQNYQEEQYGILLFVALLTATTDKRLRGQATKTLVHLGEKFPNALLKVAQQLQFIKDGFISESLICGLTGATLRLKNKAITEKVIHFFEQSFLQNNPTNHVAVLDYIKVVFNFAQYHFNLGPNTACLYRNKDEKWVADENEIKAIGYDPWRYQMLDYDFVKYQITLVSNDSSRSKSPYSKPEIISFISQKIQQKGYSSHKYKAIEAALKAATKYERDEKSERVISYAEKYLDITYLELAGYLMLNGYITSEKDNTFRFVYINYDPTFPEILSKIQLLNDNFLPKSKADIQNWVLADSAHLLDELYVTTPLFLKQEMVLLHATIQQEDKEQQTRISIDVTAFLFKEIMRNEVIRLFSNAYQSMDDFSQLFSGEIPWMNLYNADETNYYYTQKDLFSCICRYSWTSFSDRYAHPYFEFLTPLIARTLGLQFDIANLEFVNQKGKPITKYFVTDHAQFLFIDKATLIQFLKAENYHLVWSKLVVKYGDFGNYGETTLEEPYRRFIGYRFFESNK